MKNWVIGVFPEQTSGRNADKNMSVRTAVRGDLVSRRASSLIRPNSPIDVIELLGGFSACVPRVEGCGIIATNEDSNGHALRSRSTWYWHVCRFGARRPDRCVRRWRRRWRRRPDTTAADPNANPNCHPDADSVTAAIVFNVASKPRRARIGADANASATPRDDASSDRPRSCEASMSTVKAWVYALRVVDQDGHQFKCHA